MVALETKALDATEICAKAHKTEPTAAANANEALRPGINISGFFLHFAKWLILIEKSRGAADCYCWPHVREVLGVDLHVQLSV